MSNERARWFFEAVDRYVYAQDEYTRNKNPATEKELRAAYKVIRDEVERVRAILLKDAQTIVKNIDLNKIV